MLVGIILGVAVVVAVDLANASASRAFELSVEAVAGRATHQIVGGPQGLDESVYVSLRRAGVVRAAAPFVTEYVASPQLGNQPLQLVGIDPFAEPPFRDYVGGQGNTPAAGPVEFFTRPGAIMLSADLAGRFGLAAGAHITLQIAGYDREAVLVGLVEPPDDLSRQALTGIILADIATAQELSGRLGKLDRVDLILNAADENQLNRIQALLPPDARLTAVETRRGSFEQMSGAFQLNLTALSLLALFVGVFLIYNTMTFSVVQRRPLFGTLRCLGVTRREVFALVLSEALVVGALGAALGLVVGIVLGRGAVRMVTQTINDLYFVITVSNVGIAATSLVKGAVLGIGATLIAAILPAWEACSVPARTALFRSALESRTQRTVIKTAGIGGSFLLVGGGALIWPTRSVVVGFAGTSAVVLGFAMVTPLVTRMLMRGAALPLGRLWGSLGRMAPRDVVKSLSRTSIAVAALMVAMAVTVGVNLMIGSFRHTVAHWLDYALQADIYVSASSLAAAQSSVPLDPAALPSVKSTPGVARVNLLRFATLDSPYGPIQVEASNGPDYGENLEYVAVEGSPKAAWAAVHNGAVIVSEPLAHRLGLPKHGGDLTLYTDNGPHTFPISGIYYNYASSQGKVIMSLDIYRRLWQDDAVTALVVNLEPAADVDAVVAALQQSLAPVQRVFVRSRQTLGREALDIFDRTFTITGALQLLATAVAFIGVLSTLLSLLLEKRRELGVLRSVGLTVRELYGLVLLETGLLGAVAGLLAIPAGFSLSLILIYVINRRSFGWTLQMQVGVEPFVQALVVAVAAALLAGLYPARRMGQMITAEALRYE
jgi:putative ABC transport system permease protein